MTLDDSVIDRFFAGFEAAQNAQVFDQVIPFLHPDVVFRFNDGDFRGLDEARGAFEATWAHDVKDERYWTSGRSVEWRSDDAALVTFAYHWRGTTNEGTFEVAGRGTSLLVEIEGELKLLMEHLSR